MSAGVLLTGRIDRSTKCIGARPERTQVFSRGILVICSLFFRGMSPNPRLISTTAECHCESLSRFAAGVGKKPGYGVWVPCLRLRKHAHAPHSACLRERRHGTRSGRLFLGRSPATKGSQPYSPGICNIGRAQNDSKIESNAQRFSLENGRLEEKLYSSNDKDLRDFDGLVRTEFSNQTRNFEHIWRDAFIPPTGDASCPASRPAMHRRVGQPASVNRCSEVPA